MTKVQALEAKVQQLQSRIDELDDSGHRGPTRRGMLRLAGAAAGGAVAVLTGHGEAAAGTGPMQFGATNDAGASETTLTSSSSSSTLRVACSSANGTGMRGDGVSDGTGVYGLVTSPTTYAYGVWGRSAGTQGYGVVAEGGTAQLRLAGGDPERLAVHRRAQRRRDRFCH